jgi:hypothetical protein
MLADMGIYAFVFYRHKTDILNQHLANLKSWLNILTVKLS